MILITICCYVKWAGLRHETPGLKMSPTPAQFPFNLKVLSSSSTCGLACSIHKSVSLQPNTTLRFDYATFTIIPEICNTAENHPPQTAEIWSPLVQLCNYLWQKTTKGRSSSTLPRNPLCTHQGAFQQGRKVPTDQPCWINPWYLGAKMQRRCR